MKSFAAHLPPQLKFLRACFREFQKLPLRQDTSILGPGVAAETLFTNPRFKIPLEEHKAFLWKEHMQTYTVGDLVSRDSGEPHEDDDWEQWYFELAPDPQARHVHDFAENRAAESCRGSWAPSQPTSWPRPALTSTIRATLHLSGVTTMRS